MIPRVLEIVCALADTASPHRPKVERGGGPRTPLDLCRCVDASAPVEKHPKDLEVAVLRREDKACGPVLRGWAGEIGELWLTTT